jgi:hypothetical protein
MTEFETEGVLSVVLDQSSLQSARDEVEQTIGSVAVDVQASPARADGGVMGGANVDAMLSLDEDRNDILEDILDELEQGGVGGGGGGGGVTSLIPGLGGEGDGGGLLGGLLGGSAGAAGGAGLLGALATGGLVAGGIAGATAGAGTLPGLLRDDIDVGAESLLFSGLTGASALGGGGLATLLADDIATGEGIPGLSGDDASTGATFDTGFESVVSQFESAGQDVAGLLEGALGTLQETPDWVTRLAQQDFQPGDTVTGPGGATLRTTPDGQVVPSRGGEIPNAVTTDRGVTRRVDTRGQIIPDRGTGQRQPGSLSTGPDQPRQQVDVTVQNDIQSEVALDSVRDLQEFLRSPERFIENALNIGRGRGP